MAIAGKKLSDREIELIVTKHAEGLRRESIAAVLNCSVRTVERYLKRVRQLKVIEGGKNGI